MTYLQHRDDSPPPPINHNQHNKDGTEGETNSSQTFQGSSRGSQVHPNPEDNVNRPNLHYQASPTSYSGYQQNYGPRQSSPIVTGMSIGPSKLVASETTMDHPARAELQNGNLALDVQVPGRIIPEGMSENKEMAVLRYTAVTCDPDDFKLNGYSLRQCSAELFIVITMYDEDEDLFVKTMNAVIKNIAHLCSISSSKTWGPNSWEKVVVCIVSDGRKKINKRILDILTLMGCYQEGIIKDSQAVGVTAHIFEYTTNVVVTAAGEVSFGPCPVQVLFCLKEQNRKKLNSHRWFFNAFCPLINPNVCILLDVGTKPTGTSIYELWKCFIMDSNVGGACGEICVDTGGRWSLFFSPLAASQNFEYKMSNILDKPFESVFGYISVLPGAFSAYKYKALLNGDDGKGPLNSYFKGDLEKMHDGVSDAGLFERNMYLAEDRILCFEIVTKKREGWVLKYVKSAKASTDVPTTVPKFIKQRRRWLNGSLFTSIHSTIFFYNIWTSGQRPIRKLVLQIEFIYNAVQLFFTLTSLANFYLAFFFLVSSATAPGKDSAFNFLSSEAGTFIFEVFLKLYIALLFLTTICSLGNRPEGAKWIYALAMILFGCCNVITVWCAGYTVYLAVPHSESGWDNISNLVATNQAFREIVISLVATYGIYLISSVMYLDPGHMFTSFIQYMFLLPTYVNILMMYAMYNLHDVTWGTRGDDPATNYSGGAKESKGDGGDVTVQGEITRNVDQLWITSQDALKLNDSEPKKAKEKRDAKTKQNDLDCTIRTTFVCGWVAINMAMIIGFTSTAFVQWADQHLEHTQSSNFNPYLSFLVFVLTGLSGVRFLGSFLYLIFRLFDYLKSRLRALRSSDQAVAATVAESERKMLMQSHVEHMA